ncbi:DUF397 domain-containing protein [Streptomyces sp. SID4919]|uniref:DUF397 domain-containing protein n=1 Tax=unclassified Streptomyces TaxID=2593676 RepID=UPI0008238B20|nr:MULTISPECIES: DUF397 domain-containing protein [unclassified Streptomyces]MYY10038.1 DUF397 domain-containing protein [Streptomyces sp. SID4919]SCK49993.1 protein of unknown function [Streptomyces sp. AmelKG-E11A]
MATTDFPDWTKSSYSNNGGNCVEWAPSHATGTGIVPVRDSKRVNGPVLMVSTRAFAGLVLLARSAEL